MGLRAFIVSILLFISLFVEANTEKCSFLNLKDGEIRKLDAYELLILVNTYHFPSTFPHPWLFAGFGFSVATLGGVGLKYVHVISEYNLESVIVLLGVSFYLLTF